MEPFLAILGTAHLEKILGKGSPDGTFKEWRFSRELCRNIRTILDSRGVPCIIDHLAANIHYPSACNQKELQKLELFDRVQLVNSYASLFGKDNIIYVSCHVNASGMGDRWMPNRGWCCHTSRGRTKSDALADLFYSEAEKILPKGTTFYEDWSDGDPDIESGLYVLTNTACPAVLTENFFMDNLEDLKYLQSGTGMTEIATLHANAIYRYFQTERLAK